MSTPVRQGIRPIPLGMADPEIPMRIVALRAGGGWTGARFHVTRVAPMGDPVEIRVRGYRLSIRKHEAGSLRVEKAR